MLSFDGDDDEGEKEGLLALARSICMALDSCSWGAGEVRGALALPDATSEKEGLKEDTAAFTHSVKISGSTLIEITPAVPRTWSTDVSMLPIMVMVAIELLSLAEGTEVDDCKDFWVGRCGLIEARKFGASSWVQKEE